MAQQPIRGNPRAKSSANAGNVSKRLDVSAQVAPVSDSEPQFNVTTVGKVRRQTNLDRKRARAKQRRSDKKAGVNRPKKHINKARILFIFIIVLVAGLAGGFVFVQTTGFINIKNVEYVGADHLTQAECEALGEKPIGESLLTFDESKIESGMLRTSWIESVSFERVFPDTLRIHVNERKIGAIVDFTSGSQQVSQSWIITLDGMWIMAIPEQTSEMGQQISQTIYSDAEKSVHITDCPNGISPKIGSTSTDSTVLNALSILKGMTTDLKDQVQTISASSISATTIKLSNNIEVAFGQADQIREKERIVKEILEQNQKVVYINVRTVDRPTWRAA